MNPWLGCQELASAKKIIIKLIRNKKLRIKTIYVCARFKSVFSLHVVRVGSICYISKLNVGIVTQDQAGVMGSVLGVEHAWIEKGHLYTTHYLKTKPQP